MEKMVCTFCGKRPVVAYMATYEPNRHEEEPSEITAACKDHVDVLDEIIDRKHPDMREQMDAANEWEGAE